MKVLLTGGTGFVGTAVREQLLSQGHSVRLLVRAQSYNKWEKLKDHPDIELIQGDISDLESMKRATSAVEAIIHLVGIIREGRHAHESFEWVHITGTQTLIEAAQDNAVMRIIFISALGTRENARTRYHRTKYEAEQIVARSGLTFTILRPSIMWGPNDEFVNRLRKFVHPPLPVLVPGSGKAKFQPVYVGDLAQGLVKCLRISSPNNQIFEVGGSESLTLNQIIDRIAHEKGATRCLKIPIPLIFLYPLTAMFQYSLFYPLTLEQLKLLNEDNVTTDTRFWQVTGIKPRSFLDYSGI